MTLESRIISLSLWMHLSPRPALPTPPLSQENLILTEEAFCRFHIVPSPDLGSEVASGALEHVGRLYAPFARGVSASKHRTPPKLLLVSNLP